MELNEFERQLEDIQTEQYRLSKKMITIVNTAIKINGEKFKELHLLPGFQFITKDNEIADINNIYVELFSVNDTLVYYSPSEMKIFFDQYNKSIDMNVPIEITDTILQETLPVDNNFELTMDILGSPDVLMKRFLELNRTLIENYDLRTSKYF